MKRIGWLIVVCGCAIAADRSTVITDPAHGTRVQGPVHRADGFLGTRHRIHPAESAAMEAGKKMEPLLMQGPDDPLGKKALATGEPSFDALASLYPGKILDRTVLGTYSDPRQPMSDYSDEFCHLLEWRNRGESHQGPADRPLRRDRCAATGAQHDRSISCRGEGEAFGRVRRSIRASATSRATCRSSSRRMSSMASVIAKRRSRISLRTRAADGTSRTYGSR